MDRSADNGGGPRVALSHGPGQQDGAPPGRPPTDGFAVATLITGIVPLIPLTLVLGVVALIRIARTGARGRGLAITGLVLAGLWAIAGAAAAAVLITQHQPAKPVALPRIFQLHTGQCLNSSSNGISGVHVLPCSQPHSGEVFGTFQVAGHRYPGSAVLQREASGGCVSRLSGYLNPQLSASSLTESYVYPDSGAWAAGVRTVVCTVRSTAGPLTGSVRGATGQPRPR
jgi:putative regulator of septum formation